MNCYYHPELDANATCKTCGKALCNDCAVQFGNIIKCRECINIKLKNPEEKNILAVISMIVAIMGLVGCLCGGGIGGIIFGLPASVTGLIARNQIKKNPTAESSLTYANIGFFLGLVELIISILLIILIGGLWGTAFLSTLLFGSDY